MIRSYQERGVPARILHGLGRALHLAEKDQELIIAYDQVGNTRDEVAYVESDLTQTDPGGQLFRVRVTDRLTGESTTKEIAFMIVWSK